MNERNERIQKIVDGMGLDLEATFGPGTTIDDLSTCAHHLDTCGCVREFLWSRKDDRPERAEVPVSTPSVCAHHGHLTGDMGALHDVVLQENKHKNRVLLEVLEDLPPQHKATSKDVEGNDVPWFKNEPRFHYDADRELHVEVPGLSLAERATLRAKIDRKFQARRAKVV